MNSPDPVVGQLIGLDSRQSQRLNRVTLRAGRVPGTDANAGGELEALVSEGFAVAHGLKAGAQAAALDMAGAFNHLALRLAPGASQPAVIDAVDRLLASSGGQPARPRKDQVSHAMLDNEIREQRVLGTLLPSIFLAVAAFLLHVVAARLVSTQCEQIAALKALGYGNRSIALHYLKLVAPMVGGGYLAGLLLGDWLGGQLTGLYADFFRFPSFTHRWRHRCSPSAWPSSR